MEKLKILIVEDDRVILRLYDKFLVDDVFDKQLTANGEEAMKIYHAWEPDIILLDIMLPVMDGHEVLKEIRHTFEDTETPIIMSTSSSEKDEVLSCAKLGIQGYILKPFKPQEIPCKILEYYGKANPERAKAAMALLEKNVEEQIS